MRRRDMLRAGVALSSLHALRAVAAADDRQIMFIPGKDVVLATESFGDPADPAVLLIMGSTASMLGWPDELCIMLAGAGFHVIRFDHRDTGESSTVPPGEARYTVEDMAGDVIAILDGYRISAAHLVGMSLGAYIAQMIALEHAGRVKSLSLIAAEPLGWDGVPLPHISSRFLNHFAGLETLDWTDRAAATDFLLKIERLSSSQGEGFDEARARKGIERVLGRTTSPASMFNHSTLQTARDWSGRFRDIRQPVLVVHGDNDPILPVENGKAIAEGIAGAQLIVLRQTGHALPLEEIPSIVGHVEHHLKQVERDR